MEINVIIDLIQSVGFPIFVAVWLLTRSESRDEKMIQALNELKAVVQDYHKYLDKRA